MSDAWMERADAETTSFLRGVMQEHHERLVKAKVRVALVMMHPALNEKTGDPKEPAVKWHGHAALAVVKLAKPVDRLLGKYDVLIKVDAHNYDLFNDHQRAALLDHELTHVEVIEKEGEPAKHDDGTPKLKLRKDAYLLTGFFEVIKRHGKWAPELTALQGVIEGVQDVFPFMKEKVA